MVSFFSWDVTCGLPSGVAASPFLAAFTLKGHLQHCPQFERANFQFHLHSASHRVHLSVLVMPP